MVVSWFDPIIGRGAWWLALNSCHSTGLATVMAVTSSNGKVMAIGRRQRASTLLVRRLGHLPLWFTSIWTRVSRCFGSRKKRKKNLCRQPQTKESKFRKSAPWQLGLFRFSITTRRTQAYAWRLVYSVMMSSVKQWRHQESNHKSRARCINSKAMPEDWCTVYFW